MSISFFEPDGEDEDEPDEPVEDEEPDEDEEEEPDDGPDDFDPDDDDPDDDDPDDDDPDDDDSDWDFSSFGMPFDPLLFPGSDSSSAASSLVWTSGNFFLFCWRRYRPPTSRLTSGRWIPLLMLRLPRRPHPLTRFLLLSGDGKPPVSRRTLFLRRPGRVLCPRRPRLLRPLGSNVSRE